ncbi:unnamed protein product, partial [Iphiclides podalirius]
MLVVALVAASVAASVVALGMGDTAATVEADHQVVAEKAMAALQWQHWWRHHGGGSGHGSQSGSSGSGSSSGWRKRRLGHC